MYHEIDLSTWDRRNTFHFFNDYDDPFFNVSGNLDVTVLRRFCREKKESFYLNTLYFSLKIANELESFRLRKMDDKVICYDKIRGGSTTLYEDLTFGFTYFDYLPDRLAFIEQAGRQIEAQKEKQLHFPEDDSLDMIHYSVVPWVSFASVKHPRRFGTEDSIPKIVFGKYFESGEKLLMPLSVEVHHSLMDGYHVGMYFEKLQKAVDNT